MSEKFSLRRDHPRCPAHQSNRRAGTAACGSSFASIARTRYILIGSSITFLAALSASYFATILGMVCGPSLASIARTRYILTRSSVPFPPEFAASYFITERERPSHV